MPDVALLIDWENVYYTLRQHTSGPLPSTLSILQAILQKAAEFGPVRVKLAIFGQEVASQDDTLLMALEFTGIEPIAVAQRMSGRLLKGRSDAVLITRAMKLLYKDRPDIEVWMIVSGDRDLNALCKALKDEDKKVFLVAGDLSLANELRDSPYLRDDVFLLEELIPEARWNRHLGGPRADEPKSAYREQPPERADRIERAERVDRAERAAPERARGRRRGGRARGASVPAVVPSEDLGSEKEQRRLAVLLLDQLVALRANSMARGEFVQSVVPLSEKEASSVLEERIDAAIEQGHIVATQPARSRVKAKQLLAPAMASPLVAETFFHLVRVLRRIDTVTSKDTRRVPAVEAVLDPLARADQPGGIAKGRSQRRVLLETLFNIAEERGAIATEQVTREERQITMCWVEEGHPLVRYARQPEASIVHLFNFVSAAKPEADLPDWVNAALFPELLARVEGDRLEQTMRSAIERNVMRAEERGKRAGYVLVRENTEVRGLLGEFAALNGETPAAATGTAATGTATAGAAAAEPAEGAAPRKRTTRRGSRGGRGRRGGARSRQRATEGTEAAAE